MTSPSLSVGIALGGVGDRDLVRGLLVLLVGHDGPAAERLVVAGLAVDRHARVDLLVRKALLRRRRERRLERREHDVLRHVLLARKRVDEQQHAFAVHRRLSPLDLRHEPRALDVRERESSRMPFAVSTSTRAVLDSPAAMPFNRRAPSIGSRSVSCASSPGEPREIRRLLERPVEPRRAHLEPLVVDVLDREQPRQVVADTRAQSSTSTPSRLVDEHAHEPALRRQLPVDELEPQRGQRRSSSSPRFIVAAFVESGAPATKKNGLCPAHFLLLTTA